MNGENHCIDSIVGSTHIKIIRKRFDDEIIVFFTKLEIVDWPAEKILINLDIKLRRYK